MHNGMKTALRKRIEFRSSQSVEYNVNDSLVLVNRSNIIIMGIHDNAFSPRVELCLVDTSDSGSTASIVNYVLSLTA